MDKDRILDLLDSCQTVLAKVGSEGDSQYANIALQVLADVVMLNDELKEEAEHDSFLDEFGVNVMEGDLREPRTDLEFEGIHSAVLSAVWSACDSAENANLEGWEVDLIESRIVEHHTSKKLLQQLQTTKENDEPTGSPENQDQ